MKIPNLKTSILFLLCMFTLSACGGGTQSSSDSTQSQITNTAPNSHEILSRESKGFVVGSNTGTTPVYVMFDPQCLHCANLWKSAIPLQNKVKFIWIPVAFLNSKSKPQAAAILSATNPWEAMARHEETLAAGGISIPQSIPTDVDAAIVANTNLMKTVGATGVPFIVAIHAKTSLLLAHSGSMSTNDFADWLGVERP